MPPGAESSIALMTMKCDSASSALDNFDPVHASDAIAAAILFAATLLAAALSAASALALSAALLAASARARAALSWSLACLRSSAATLLASLSAAACALASSPPGWSRRSTVGCSTGDADVGVRSSAEDSITEIRNATLVHYVEKLKAIGSGLLRTTKSFYLDTECVNSS